MPFVKWLTTLFRKSQRIHIHHEVGSVSDAIGVIDRFIDGTLKYPLEWDDFISWTSSIDGVERLRNEIAELESMFFSAQKATKREALRTLIEIRNRYAVFNGIVPRTVPG